MDGDIIRELITTAAAVFSSVPLNAIAMYVVLEERKIALRLSFFLLLPQTEVQLIFVVSSSF